MPEYRIYVVGRDGHFSNVKTVECDDDQKAAQEAAQVFDGHDVEIWEQSRFVARFPSNDPKSAV
jgi:hypothetical protein